MQASATQRAGRAGRLFPGKIFRLYTEGDFKDRAPFDDPEMLRVSLSATILRLKVMNGAAAAAGNADVADAAHAGLGNEGAWPQPSV